MRISGVPVGKVKDDRARQAHRPLAGRRSSSSRGTRRCPPTRGRSCARRRCWARPTSSSRRARRSARPIKEGGILPASQVSPTGRARRDLPLVRRAHAAQRSRSGCRRRRRRSTAAGSDLNDAFGNLGPFADDASELVDILNRQQGAVQRLISRHRRGVRRADRARRPAALADRELQHRVRHDRVARPGAPAGVHRAADVRARVAHDADAADRVRRQHRPAGHAAAPGGARAVADARSSWPGSRPTSRRSSATSSR